MKIRTITINPPVALAPMAGVTDLAFRTVCRAHGASFTVTEMVSSRALVYQDKKSNQLLELAADEHPSAVQIFGNDPGVMAEAALIALERSGADAVDLNMGCPTPKIVQNRDGCALMQNPSRAGEIISAVAKAVRVPVTVKFRAGWDDASKNAVEFGRVAEACGASALCVHGRTRAQMYAGKADRNIIRQVVDAVSIPVFANGDVASVEDYFAMLDQTRAAGVMIGRAAFGNPWLFAQIKAAINQEEIPPLPGVAERLETAVRQYELALTQKGERVASLEARKYFAWYLKGVRGANAYKDQLFQLSTAQQVRETARMLQEKLG